VSALHQPARRLNSDQRTKEDDERFEETIDKSAPLHYVKEVETQTVATD